MPSMTSATLPTSLEMTMKMSEEWEQEHTEERERIMQGGDPGVAQRKMTELEEEWRREEEETWRKELAETKQEEEEDE